MMIPYPGERARQWTAAPSAPFGFVTGPWSRRRPSRAGLSSGRAALRTKADVLEMTEGEFEPDEWVRHRIPNSRRWIYLPSSFDGHYWDQCVETVAQAMAVDDGSSSYGWVARLEICRSGTVWFLAHSRDDDLDVTILGEFDDPAVGRLAGIQASGVFISGPERRPVAPESEREEIDWDVESLAELAADDEEWQSVAEQVKSLSVVTDHEVELVGRDGASVMPGDDLWWLVPMGEADAADLVTSGVDAWPVTLSVAGLSTRGVIAPLPEAYGAALAEAHGLREVAVLTNEHLYLIDVDDGYCRAVAARDLSDLRGVQHHHED